MVVSVVTGSVNVGYEQYDTRFKKYQKHSGLDYICRNCKNSKLATKWSCSCIRRINYCDT